MIARLTNKTSTQIKEPRLPEKLSMKIKGKKSLQPNFMPLIILLFPAKANKEKGLISTMIWPIITNKSVKSVKPIKAMTRCKR